MSKRLPLFIFILSLAYLSVLATKSYSWIFVSSDSGSWLASATQWMVPTPYGAPIYVLLGRFLSLFGGIEITMPIFLSALPSAISVLIVYLVVRKLTQNIRIAVVSSMALMGSAVFLTQATTLGYHAMAAMFITLAIYAYVTEQYKWTIALLGLGTAVHIIVVPITGLWFIGDVIYNWKEKRWKFWLKNCWLYIVFGVLPYSLILALMASDTPRFLAGGLNLASIKAYWYGSSGIVGAISVFEFPDRLLHIIQIMLMSFGIALIPATIYLVRFFKRKEKARFIVPLIATSLYGLWYVLTNLDVLTWTYIAFFSSSVAILVGLGLKELSHWHVKAVAVGAAVLIMLNLSLLNANELTNENPKGTTYLSELNSLPEGAIVVVEPGPYSLGMFYAINKGKDVVPLVYPYMDYANFGMKDYGEYLEYRWDIIPDSTLGVVVTALSQGKPVYEAVRNTSVLKRSFTTQGNGMIKRITGLTGEEPGSYMKSWNGK